VRFVEEFSEGSRRRVPSRQSLEEFSEESKSAQRVLVKRASAESEEWLKTSVVQGDLVRRFSICAINPLLRNRW
jgi:hypothetical protein